MRNLLIALLLVALLIGCAGSVSMELPQLEPLPSLETAPDYGPDSYIRLFTAKGE